MAVWSDFYNDVLPEVPGCPTALAEHEIKRACIDFMVRTQIQRKTVVNIDHPGTATPLDLTHTDYVAATEQVCEVLAVWVDDKPLDCKSVAEIQQEYPDWMTVQGTPEYYVQEGTALWLVPSPAAALTNAIKVRISYAPNNTATSIPDSVFNRYGEEIAIGAKGRLLAKPKKPWTDPSIAGEYLRVYSRAVDAATIRSARGGAKVRWSVPTRSF